MRIFKKRNVTKYYSGDRMEQDELGRARGTYWGEEKYIYTYRCRGGNMKERGHLEDLGSGGVL